MANCVDEAQKVGCPSQVQFWCGRAEAFDGYLKESLYQPLNRIRSRCFASRRVADTSPIAVADAESHKGSSEWHPWPGEPKHRGIAAALSCFAVVDGTACGLMVRACLCRSALVMSRKWVVQAKTNSFRWPKLRAKIGGASGILGQESLSTIESLAGFCAFKRLRLDDAELVQHLEASGVAEAEGDKWSSGWHLCSRSLRTFEWL
ncbi:hypothetical protein cyc_03540 [Cyclospora cayetanensis]|uniref:Uncharacterized protein n=1 Tax=Cyclospora cayetanensis TaxID=88456 RepID=A0A1D3CX24_9EIME|nr:hypothetical protein cyc_03540 [Cyclospora cayetanensis]